MTMKNTFGMLDDREAAITAFSVIAMHALISSGKDRTGEACKPETYVSQAFDIGTAFVEATEKRFGKLES